MMATLRDIARYLVYSYETLTQSQITNSELTLHKLLYFAQKESLAFNGEPLFLESFEGWKHGPVLTELRFFFDEDFETMTPEETERLTDRERYILDNVVVQYGKYAAWALRDLTHKENAWIKSRAGLSADASGKRIITLADIKEDAAVVRLFDHQFDMFVDEYDDFNGETISC